MSSQHARIVTTGQGPPDSFPNSGPGIVWLLARQHVDVFWTLGNLFTSVSVFNLIRRYYDIPLNSLLIDIIAAYHLMLYNVLDRFAPTIVTPLPQWYKDLFVVSFVSCSLVVRLCAKFFIKHFVPEM